MSKSGLACAFVLALSAAMPLAADDVRSVYTDVSERKCRLLASSGAPDEDDGLSCHGPAGYGLLALSGDLRATVTVVTPDGAEHPLEFWKVITGHFSTLGPRAEWRIRGKGGTPHALIVRVIASETPEDPQQKTSYLAVAKITPEAICVTDRIAGGSGDNARARDAADSAASRPCLEALQ